VIAAKLQTIRVRVLYQQLPKLLDFLSPGHVQEVNLLTSDAIQNSYIYKFYCRKAKLKQTVAIVAFAYTLTASQLHLNGAL